MHDSTRLNGQIRDNVRNAVIRHRFCPEIQALKVERAACATEAYNRLFSKAEQEQMAALPKGWMKEDNHIDLTIGAQRHSLNFEGSLWTRVDALRYLIFEHRDAKVERRMPFDYKPLQLTARDNLAMYIHKVEQQHSALEENFSKACLQIRTMLCAYHTIGTLKAAWPEVAPFLPKTKPKPPAALPTVRPEELNQLLKLPA